MVRAGVRHRRRRRAWRGARPRPSIPTLATGEVEVVAEKVWILNEIAHAAVPHGRERGRERGRAPEVPLRRPAPAAHAAQHHPALEDLVRGARVPVRAGLPRNRDALHDALHAGGRARLPGAQPRAAGHLLRPAAVAADLQAAADGERLREVLPDRALLPRRGPARRPPAGIHADRPGDVVPAAGAHLRGDRAAGAARLRGGGLRGAGAVPAPHLRRGHAQLRHRQARPAHAAHVRAWRTCCRTWPPTGCRWWPSTSRAPARSAARSATN